MYAINSPKYFSAPNIIQSPTNSPHFPGNSAGRTNEAVHTPKITSLSLPLAKIKKYKERPTRIPFHPSQSVTARVGSREVSWGVLMIL